MTLLSKRCKSGFSEKIPAIHAKMAIADDSRKPDNDQTVKVLAATPQNTFMPCIAIR